MFHTKMNRRYEEEEEDYSQDGEETFDEDVEDISEERDADQIDDCEDGFLRGYNS